MARQFYSEATADVTVTTTTETVALTLPAVSTAGAGDTVGVSGSLQVTIGTGGTAVTVRVRRGTGITGTIVGESNPITVTAADKVDLAVDASDQPGEVAGQSYVVTVQQTAATGDGTVSYAAAAITIV